ncbi:sialoadhesin isoform X2 [Microcaecilia unicolor]|uniref:Sialoadhesin-like isoform X2 n=1 Tax=Microcaecilia unicolor TaxID=1415580 RepID=A0A6P7Z1N4_9AMPH|nr:sialoadhesin-like isoform X2 [Microcaecilia unicolor]
MEFLQRLLTFTLLQGSFSQSWSVWMPSSIQALKDSCVVIPCNFTYHGYNRNFSIAWYLYRSVSYPIVYNSIDSQSVEKEFKDRTAFVGNMENKNCSLQIDKVRGTDEDQYYPIINEDRYRFWDYRAQVKVSDKPDELSLSYPEIMSEGESVTINCSAEHTCPSSPPSLNWDRFGSTASVHQEELSDGRWRTVTMLSYIPSPEDHEKHLQCVATYPNMQQSKRSITFNIKYAPKGTHLVAPKQDQIHAGNSLVLKCESGRSNPAVTHYTWYKDGNLIVNQSQKSMQIQAVTAQDAGVYRCAAHNEIGSLSSIPVTIHVSIPGDGHSSTYIAVLGGVTGVICLLLMGLGIFIIARKRKMQKTARNVTITTEDNPIADSAISRAVREEIPLTDEHLYWNIALQRPNSHLHNNHYGSSSRHPEGGHQTHSESTEAATAYAPVKKQGKKKQIENQSDQHHSQQENLHYSSVLHEHPENVHYSTVMHSQPEEPQYSTVLRSQPPSAPQSTPEVKDLVEYAPVKY